MQVSLKEEYKGQLSLRFDELRREFHYILGYSTYPSYEYQTVDIEDGDELIVRSPFDGSILIRREIEFDYDSQKQIDLETGVVHQLISGHPVCGILKNIEPAYWFNIFAQSYPADLIKKV